MKMRKLTEKDHEKVWAFIQREPSKNLFIIGDIEVYGYEQDFQELWGEFDTEGNIKSILLRYYESFIVDGVKGYDATAMLEVINSYEHSMISGDKEILQELEKVLSAKEYSVRDTFFAECTKNSLMEVDEIKLTEEIKLATVNDALRIATLENQIDEFESLKKTSIAERVKQIQKKLDSRAGRTYFIENEEEIISLASTTAENSVSAMIIGVCTKEEYRKRGYVSAILFKLLTNLFMEKKAVCLFYDNPEAGNIYKRNGFKDIGIWRMLIKS